jgi:hypothetical protein
VDDFPRLSANQVRIRGWSANITGRGTPITVVAFVDGKNARQVQTNGPRPDVRDRFELPAEAALNLAFEGVLFCRPSRRAFIVAVKRDSYTKLTDKDGLLCPP